MLLFILWLCRQQVALQENSDLNFTACLSLPSLYRTFGALCLDVSLNLALLPAEVLSLLF